MKADVAQKMAESKISLNGRPMSQWQNRGDPCFDDRGSRQGDRAKRLGRSLAIQWYESKLDAVREGTQIYLERVYFIASGSSCRPLESCLRVYFIASGLLERFLDAKRIFRRGKTAFSIRHNRALRPTNDSKALAG
jgi:hypothetical protein